MEKWKACIRAFRDAVKQAWTTFVAAMRRLALTLWGDIRAVGAMVVQLWHKWLG